MVRARRRVSELVRRCSSSVRHVPHDHLDLVRPSAPAMAVPGERLDEELLKVMMLVKRRTGFVSLDEVVREVERRPALVAGLKGAGLSFPFTNHPLIHGLYVLEREMSLAVRLRQCCDELSSLDELAEVRAGRAGHGSVGPRRAVPLASPGGARVRR